MSHPLLIDSEVELTRLLRGLRRVAVLGIKTEQQRDQPAYYVAADLAARGLEIVPVPVYYPEVREILGQPVYRRLVDIPARWIWWTCSAVRPTSPRISTICWPRLPRRCGSNWASATTPPRCVWPKPASRWCRIAA